jgi:hypothetical protein
MGTGVVVRMGGGARWSVAAVDGRGSVLIERRYMLSISV